MATGTQPDAGQILNSLINSILLIDDNLAIHYANPAAQQLLAQSSRKLFGTPLPELLSYFSLNIELMQESLEAGQGFTDNEVTLVIDGRSHILSVTAQRMPDGMILLAFLLLGEPIGLFQGAGVVLIGTGTLLMIEKKAVASDASAPGKGWMLYAIGSAVFASLTSILGKIGISGVESNLGTAIRTGVVLVMAWIMVLATGKPGAVRNIPPRELAWICLSGLATGASWLCYYRALQDGPASVVVPIDKLSILVTVAFSRVVFREKLITRSGCGLVLIVTGTLIMLL